MVNQLGNFVPHLVEKNKPIRDLLSSKNEFLCGPTQQDAFEKPKKELTSIPVLAQYDTGRKRILSAEALSYIMDSAQCSYKNKTMEQGNQ